MIAVWEGSLLALHDAAATADDAGWATPTECPGWTVGDVVAHVIGIERALGGLADPPHEPDWSALPHVTDDFGRFTEVAVDLRRGRPRASVLDELLDTVDQRREQLLAGPLDVAAEVPGVTGRPTPIVRFLGTRIFDVWAHEQDVRRALRTPGHLGSPAAWVSADRLVAALPYVWGKAVAAPAGSSVRLDVTGPGVVARATAVVGEDGRAVAVRDADVPDPTVTLTVAWPDYVALGCGRVPPGATAARVGGDADLGARLLASLAVTP